MMNIVSRECSQVISENGDFRHIALWETIFSVKKIGWVNLKELLSSSISKSIHSWHLLAA